MLRLPGTFLLRIFRYAKKIASVNGHFLTHFPRVCRKADMPAFPLEKCVSANARRKKCAIHLHTRIKCVGSTQEMCGKNALV